MEALSTETLGKDVFLRLLTTQLKFQDPLEPMQGTEFVTQLAQFSQVEQATSMNDRLDSIIKGNAALTNYGVTSLIGKEVKVLGGSVLLNDGGSPELSYHLEQAAQEIIIKVMDASGTLLRELRPGPQLEGAHLAFWDGRDQAGNALLGGDYQFLVSARDVNDQPVKVDQFSQGIVTGVVYENGLPYLRVNGEQVPASEVVSVS